MNFLIIKNVEVTSGIFENVDLSAVSFFSFRSLMIYSLYICKEVFYYARTDSPEPSEAGR